MIFGSCRFPFRQFPRRHGPGNGDRPAYPEITLRASRAFFKTPKISKGIPYSDLTFLFVKSRTAVTVNPAAQTARSAVLPKA